jgi:hypothetical protein
MVLSSYLQICLKFHLLTGFYCRWLVGGLSVERDKMDNSEFTDKMRVELYSCI